MMMRLIPEIGRFRRVRLGMFGLISALFLLILLVNLEISSVSGIYFSPAVTSNYSFQQLNAGPWTGRSSPGFMFTPVPFIYLLADQSYLHAPIGSTVIWGGDAASDGDGHTHS